VAVARIEVPKTAKRGEIVDIRTLIGHTMETGYRRDYLGQAAAARYHHRLYLHV
jgi:sulfur-oxidizing protein SoxZ